MGYDEFMELTPRYFDTLMKQHRLSVERAERGRDFMLSQLILGVYMNGTRQYTEPLKASQFLPAWQRGGDDQLVLKKRRSRADIADQVRHALAPRVR